MQTVLVLGMWVYAINTHLIGIDPGMLSLTWMSFYLSFILAEVAWVMFIIREVKSSEKNFFKLLKGEYRIKKSSSQIY
ncbi:hypothetical protein [Piscibacillus salipiscarius]|uniref:hypothetical protein n=1 Tax=Piscibacillus salipiscarius TaxID=299480 RepID=UPI0024367B54|nr:hypothetical protein [Piscibacillus salipiscarius]